MTRGRRPADGKLLPNPSTTDHRKVELTTGGPSLLRDGGGVVFRTGDDVWWEWWGRPLPGGSYEVRRVLVAQRGVLDSFVSGADVDRMAHAFKSTRAQVERKGDAANLRDRVEPLLMAASYFGFDQLDDMPVLLSSQELRARWGDHVNLS